MIYRLNLNSYQTIYKIGHVEEVSALSARPAQGGPGQFLTAGHDRMIHLWDSFSHVVIWSFDLGEQVCSLKMP